MKLIERELGIEIELKENTIAVLVVEDVSLRLPIIEALYLQLTGKEGNWLLVENEKTYELSKNAELILEPFSLQLNNKKAKTKLYHEMKMVTDDLMYSQGIEVHSHICNYLETLLEKIPYPITYENDWNVLELFKCYDVQLADESGDVSEKLFYYIKLMNQLCGVNLFIIVNLKQYLSEEQLMEFYKLGQYNKIQLVLIEFNVGDKKMACEDMYILDKDDCVIIY